MANYSEAKIIILELNFDVKLGDRETSEKVT
jgi:hypothetical protein